MPNDEDRYWWAYYLGQRDARLGHAETHPVHPYSRAELLAYQRGHLDKRVEMAIERAKEL
jgi:hypothetical protein